MIMDGSSFREGCAYGGASGSASGPGHVYVMTYNRAGSNYYKIGCTSRDPNVRLAEIRRREQNDDITLVGSVQANEMNTAETAAQEAVKSQLRLEKDPERGGATDWFIGTLLARQVFDVVQSAVQRHNASHA